MKRTVLTLIILLSLNTILLTAIFVLVYWFTTGGAYVGNGYCHVLKTSIQTFVLCSFQP